MVDVTHDGHHRRPGDQAVLGHLGVEVDVELREQLTVLVLGADDLHVETEVLTEQLAACRRSTDCVAVTISPRLNISWTSDPGLALILSAKSERDAPRDSRISWPLPRGAPELIAGADRLSNS